MSIASSSMLVELNISVWTGNKVDKTVTRQVTDDNSATTLACPVLRACKMLSKEEALLQIQ